MVFVKLEKQEVLGMLKASGSRDRDVLAAGKSQFLRVAKFQKMVGTIFMVLGILSSLTILLAIIGIPMAIAGWFIRSRGVKNLETVEAAFAECTAGL